MLERVVGAHPAVVTRCPPTIGEPMRLERCSPVLPQKIFVQTGRDVLPRKDLVFVSVALTSLARSYNREWPTLATYGAKAIAFLLTCFVFFLIYRVIPDPPVGTGVAGRAALWAGTGWEAAKYLFVINLTRANLPAVYGPLAFAVSLVLWAYVSSLVLVFGALMSPRAGPSGRSAQA